MMRRLTVREQKIFIVCLAALFLSVSYNGLVGPLQTKTDFLDQEIVIQQNTIKQNLKIIHNAKSLDVQYGAYLKQFRQPGTKEKTTSLILSEIEGAAGQLGLHVMDLRPQKTRQNRYDNQFSVSLTINSKFVDVIRFLHTLQQKPYLFNVEEVQFEKLARRNQLMLTTQLVLSKAFIPSDSAGKEAPKEMIATRYRHD